MSVQSVICRTCGSSDARAVGVDAVFCDSCRTADLGTCVKCGERNAETSRVADGEIYPVCYLCKSV